LFDYNVGTLARRSSMPPESRRHGLGNSRFLKWPIIASLVIAGIHAYLGLHVVERGVIFVDLSLAQIASLGATLAI
jgi:ABC-type Mn2+/Zn2+ transport system permease subunit